MREDENGGNGERKKTGKALSIKRMIRRTEGEIVGEKGAGMLERERKSDNVLWR